MEMRFALLAVFFGLCLCSPAFAEIHVSTVLIADHILDIQSGKLLDHQAILITDGKIAGIGPIGELRPPTGTKIITLQAGATLLPGLIDAHTHLLESFDPKLGGDEPNQVLQAATMSTALRALQGTKNAREDFLAGITSVRDVGNSGLNGDIALRAAISKGWVQGPRMVVSTRALAPAGGQFPRMTAEGKGLIKTEYVVISGEKDARAAVRQAVFDGADLIKVIVGNGPNLLDIDELKAVVEEAHSVNIKVAAHATSDHAVSNAIAAGVDSIEHGYRVSEGSLRIMAAKHIFLVPTDFPADSHDFVVGCLRRGDCSAAGTLEYTEGNKKRLRLAVALGVPIAFGSDEYIEAPGVSRGQGSLEVLQSYVGAGMTPIEILRAITISGAALLGIDQQVGSLEVGKLADIVAVPGNPLVDPLLLQHVGFVMSGGDVVRDDLVTPLP
jgi:imidazolonepropionase-like amidohydrolase